MNSNSSSGIITTKFVNVSDSFSDYTEIAKSNHNVIVKAKRFGKWFILKGLKQEFKESPIYVELLKKEFDLGITLDHPNVIGTVGKENDSKIGSCIVLEYIDGITLKEWIAKSPSKKERQRIALQLLDAVGYLHKKGVIHRDLKPDNILITRNAENLKIIDFGLSDTDQYAVLKQPAGSRKYAAPEQLTTDVKIDNRVDIYAVDCMFKELEVCGFVAQKASQADREKRYANCEQIAAAIKARKSMIRLLSVLILFAVLGAGVVIGASRVSGYIDSQKVLIDSLSNPKIDPQKEMELQKIDTIQQFLAQLYEPMIDVAKSSKNKMQAYDKFRIFLEQSNETQVYAVFREEVLSDIESDTEFYFDLENRLAVMRGRYFMEWQKIIDTLPDR